MSGLDEATRKLIEESRDFGRLWDSTNGQWSDTRHDEFEGTIVLPLVRAASEMSHEMAAISSVVQRALALL